MKKIIILGSTGSIGRNTLEVIKNFPQDFSIFGLSANSDIQTLSRQIKKFHPKVVSVVDTKAAGILKKQFGSRVKIFAGEDGLLELTRDNDIDLVVLAISGSNALKPLISAIEHGKDVALANKEALVMAGSIIMQKAKNKKIRIFPIDSEQSAIWQCLEENNRRYLKKIYLTASGGPLKDISKKYFKRIKLEQVLRHPRWVMGKKITVDSATLMNKGLEVIEAMHLFSVDVSQIEILIHPQVIIHSMVEFVDRSVLAQLACADMRIPIQYALSFPKRLSNGLPAIDFLKLKHLSFEKPEMDKFPCLGFAYQAARKGGSAPCVLNAADEVAVGEFLNSKIDFLSIPRIIEKTISKVKYIPRPGLSDIFMLDKEARIKAMEQVNKK